MAASHRSTAPHVRKYWKRPPDLRLSRNPYEVFLQFSFVSYALGLIIHHGPSDNSAAADLPTPVLVGLGIMIVIGAVTTLFGIWWRDDMTAAFIETAGQFGIAGPTLLYGIDIILNTKAWYAALGSLVVLFAFGASVWRIGQIVRWIRWTINNGKQAATLEAYIEEVQSD